MDGKLIEPKVAVPRKSNPKLVRNFCTQGLGSRSPRILGIMSDMAIQVMRTKKIFVGGLSATTSLEDIKAYFEQFSKVVNKCITFLMKTLLICQL